MIKKLFKWIFKIELVDLQEHVQKLKDTTAEYKIQSKKLKAASDEYEKLSKKIKNLLGNIDISVDVHQYSPSWAVVSIQGEKSDYIKFVDLGKAEIREIQKFLEKFDRAKVDASPHITPYLRFS